MFFTFGKHTGETYEWVFQHDRSYVDWLMRTKSENPEFVKAQAYYKARQYNQQYNQQQQQKQKQRTYDYNDSKFNDDFYDRFRRPPPRQAQSSAWWEVLEVAATADLQTIKKAYRKLVSKFHPDRNSSADATKKTQEINAAYDSAMKGR